MRRRCHYCLFSDPNKYSTGGQTNHTWPEYNNDGQQLLVLDTDSELLTQTGLRDRYCQFWDKLVPRLLAATTGTDFSPCCYFTIRTGKAISTYSLVYLFFVYHSF